jgi:hypothetical protein
MVALWRATGEETPKNKSAKLMAVDLRINSM